MTKADELAEFGKAVMAARTAKGWTQEELAHQALGNQDRKSYVSAVERGKQKLGALTIQKFAKALELSDTVTAPLLGLTPAPTPKEQLENVGALTRDQLELLASRFEIETPHTRADTDLRQLLTQKAEEYRSYRKIVDNIDDRVASLGNIKAAAQDAADKLNFDEVETLLSRVAEVEAEVFASTQEARAKNALLRNRPEDAYKMYVAAAEAFGDLSPLASARLRNKYFVKLDRHGTRYGGTSRSFAIKIIRPAIEALKDTDHKTDWAMTTQNLAIALQNQGTRTDGPDGTNLLVEAVIAYRDAITVYTKIDHPVNWAMTTQNLALALQSQGIRTDGPDGNAQLAEAVTAYRDALTVYTKTDHPENWAITTQNLANALQIQGTRSDGPDGTALLAEAITVYRDALTVHTKTDHPLEWAMTTQNLALALQNQGSRTDGSDGTALLAEAVADYRDALTVRTKTDHPVHWAETMENIALALEATADHKATADPRPHLTDALAHVDEALTVFDPIHLSFNHAKATRLRDRTAGKLSALDP